MPSDNKRRVSDLIEHYEEKQVIRVPKPQRAAPLPPTLAPTVTLKSVLSPSLTTDEDIGAKEEALHGQSSTRPTLSSRVSSGYIRDVPAASIFTFDAAPLHLEKLDQYLDSIEPFPFTDSFKILGKSELNSWQTYHEERKPTLWEKIILIFRKPQHSRKHQEDEKKLLHDKATIFPPMHMLPSQLTLTDLKLNHAQPAPMVTLSTILGTAINGVLGGEGSNYAATRNQLTSIEIFRDLAQMMALVLNYAAGADPNSHTLTHNAPPSTGWRYVIFGLIPEVLGFDLISAFGKAILWFFVFVALAIWALYEFWIMTKEKLDNVPGEAFDAEDYLTPQQKNKRIKRKWRKTRAYRIAITFVCTTLYVPLSKVSVDALVWSSDFWPIDNPYITEDFPSFPSTWNATLYRDPAAFCWTTTMLQPDGFLNFNWAFVIIPVAVAVLAVLTIWFPLRLYWAVQRSAPKVDPYTELGEKRHGLDSEYQRLLALDRNPLSFMYNEYRREWAGFKAIYMSIKLANVLCIVVLSKDNCLFRNVTRKHMAIIQTAVQLFLMFTFFLFDTMTSPFIDRFSNNSDWVSRVGYILISAISLLAAIGLQGKDMLDGPILLFVTAIVYSFNIYFSIIGLGVTQRWIKRMQHRLDFSIDVFSPHLDVGKHVARRIWQESISTILLTGNEFKMPSNEQILFSHLDKIAPPYLLGFRSTAGERLVENLKILREIGLRAYSKGLEQSESKDMQEIYRIICAHYQGPDAYYRSCKERPPSDVSTFFGRAAVVPFPFTVVFYYDQNAHKPVAISDPDDLRAFVQQNTIAEVLAARQVRKALRALDGCVVFAPYTAPIDPRTAKDNAQFWRNRIEVVSRISYLKGKLKIQRNSSLTWKGYNVSSGFDVVISYRDPTKKSARSVTYSARDVLDLGDDFSLTPRLIRLFQTNAKSLALHLPEVNSFLSAYRTHYTKNFLVKAHTLSYGFTLNVLANDGLSVKQVEDVLSTTERDIAVQRMVCSYSASLTATEERMQSVQRSEICQRWFLIWDDTWRRNRATIRALEQNPKSFSPHHRSSICYRPMSRPVLLRFLQSHNLFVKAGERGFFHTGFLNSIYFLLDELAFGGTAEAIAISVKRRFIPFDQLTLATQGIAGNSEMGSTVLTVNTGDATSHDDTEIRARAPFPFEMIYDREPINQWKRGLWAARVHNILDRWSETAMTWLGLRPVAHLEPGLGVNLKLRVKRSSMQPPIG